MKTNKSYTKRLRVTRNGKVLARKSGQNHFNAKEGSKTGLHKRGTVQLHLKNKFKSRYLINA
ncbi:MAG: 50S ribosomal protein L35 [Patescibacteria group bacterium]